ncbi:MAG: hypothetical protein ACK4VI_09025 [Alphaproteobacteria bacterium]
MSIIQIILNFRIDSIISHIRDKTPRSVLFLVLALAAYALWGVPTANDFGAAELIIALCLLAALVSGNIAALFAPLSKNLWFDYGRLFLFCGLIVPSALGAVILGHDIERITRDLIAFGFLLLPILFFPCLSSYHNEGNDKPKSYNVFSYIFTAACLIAVFFSLRDIAGFFGIEIWSLRSGARLDYLGNSPLVLMAAILIGGFGLKYIISGDNPRSRLIGGFMLMALVLPLLVMIISVQRAYIGLLCLSMAVTLLYVFIHAPKRALLFCVVIISCAIVFQPFFYLIFDLFQTKTIHVGLNSRAEELRAIWNELSAHGAWAVLFGIGWGGMFPSPAVADIRVNFAYGLLPAMLLKTGVIGLVLSVIYLLLMLRPMLKELDIKRLSHIIWGMALSFPLLIVALLYGSYKSLDFGILLLLIVLWPLSVADYERKSG